ncbi:MAG: GDYXXLXY domain-containing protein [Bacillota bacterium]|nr:GDYXXLXY domain-containing protein [Bacillota bacterium]MDP4170462.1 GDYXXLXY domain-containing protein [Bacillota bacterium]
MNNRAKQLLVACSLPVLILLGMCVTPLYTILYGKEIILQTKPIDPSDMFRGDYVSLRYEAEEVPKSLVESAVLKAANDGQTNFKVYVNLEKKGAVYTPSKVTLKKPDHGVYLNGNFSYMTPPDDQRDVAFIEYSLDKYFVPDNTGTKWEQNATKGAVWAKVKVNNGYAVLTGIENKMP